MDPDGSIAGHARRRSASLLPGSRDGHISIVRKPPSPKLPGDIAEVADDETSPAKETDSIPSSSDWEMDDIYSDDGLEDDEETGLTQQKRAERRKKKRRNTLLEERIVQDNATSKEEERLANASFLRDSLINGVLIAMWYTFSISISVYNKWMFSKGNLDFHFPLFTTCMHMVVQFTLASAVLYFIPSLRPQHPPSEYAPVSQSSDGTTSQGGPKKALMTGWFYLTRISPCGAATGLDIGLGNTSLKFISLTFYTMCKSSVLAYVLIFAFLFRLEKPSWTLGGIIMLMIGGVVMMVFGETSFSAVGFVLIMSSAFFSGFRWSLTQILLLRNPATSNPFSTLFFLTPVMFVALLIIALPVEGVHDLVEGIHELTAAKGVGGGVGIILFPGLLAFLMTASEFALLKRTSVVTLSVAGIFKEVLTISAASIVFGDKLTPVNVSGLLVTIASIAAYNYIKVTRMRETAKREAHAKVAQLTHDTPMLDTSEVEGRISGVEGGSGRSHGRSVSSTAGLIKNSLSISVAQLGEAAKFGDRAASSPVKRPENLE